MCFKYYWGAWISPYGEWIPCVQGGGHISLAQNICTDLGVSLKYGTDCEQYLEQCGYAKLHTFHHAITSMKELSQKQVDTIFDFMIECDYNVSELTKFCGGDTPYILLIK